MDPEPSFPKQEDPDKNHSLYGKTELHNNSDTTADSQEISQKENEFKELEQNNDNHPTRRQEEVPSGTTKIMIKGSNLSESPLSANKNIQTLSNKVDKTVNDISGGQKDKNIQKGWKRTRDKNNSGNTFFLRGLFKNVLIHIAINNYSENEATRRFPGHPVSSTLASLR